MPAWESDAYIVDAVRSPIGKKNGTLASIRGDELAGQVLNALVSRNELDPAEVEDVQLGCVTQIGEQGWNLGRMVPLVAGWPETVCGTISHRSSRCSERSPPPEPIGTRDIISTPADTTTSSCPDQTAAAALKLHCIDEPH